MHKRMRRTETLDEYNFRTWFRIICGPSDIVEASRTVKITQSISPDILAQLPRYESESESQEDYRRVGFTVPISTQDCERLVTLFQDETPKIIESK